MHIEDHGDMNKWVGDTLEGMRESLPPILEEKCPHCGLIIRYPLIARKSDIELFANMMDSAVKVMKRHGIMANLLADIRTQCLIAMAKKPDDPKAE